MGKGRIVSFDVIKFFAILMVLWGHCIQHLLSSQAHEEPIYRLIYSFHMPLFMTVVGYFSYNLISLNFEQMLCKKFRQLLLPTITFCIPLCILNIYIMGGGIINFINPLIDYFWFLKSAFICCVLFYVTVKCAIKTTANIFTVLIISIIFSQFVGLYNVMLMYPPFILGVIIKKNYSQFQDNCTKILIISSIAFISLLMGWGKYIWESNTIQSLIYTRNYRIIIGIAGSTMFISIFELMMRNVSESKKFVKTVSWIGQHTLGIYLLQVYLLELILPSLIRFDGMNFYLFNFLIAPLIACVILVLCLLLINLIKQSTLLSYCLLGIKSNKRNIVLN